MKFESALKAMREGKRVRLPCRCYMQLDDCKDSESIIDASGDEVKFDSHDLLSDQWEILE